jgi:hypothetical protein
MPWKRTLERVRLICGSTTAVIDSTSVGYPSSSSSKARVIISGAANYLTEAVAIQQNEIQYPDGVIVSELGSFEYKYTPTGPIPLTAYNWIIQMVCTCTRRFTPWVFHTAIEIARSKDRLDTRRGMVHPSMSSVCAVHRLFPLSHPQSSTSVVGFGISRRRN